MFRFAVRPASFGMAATSKPVDEFESDSPNYRLLISGTTVIGIVAVRAAIHSACHQFTANSLPVQ
jgi:hypothetical protein